jgi:hypothetical protein
LTRIPKVWRARRRSRLPHLEAFNADEQASFVLSIVDETEVNEVRQELGPEGTVDPRKLADVTDEIRFVLLSGNLAAGEGEIICQPWLSTDPPDLLISDIARDWIDKLDALGLTDLSDRLDELREGTLPLPSDLVRFGIAKKRKKPPPFERRLVGPWSSSDPFCGSAPPRDPASVKRTAPPQSAA